MYSSLTGDQPIVQKYGGTSVGSVERIRAVADRVAGFQKKGFHRIALVVSAMSGRNESAGGFDASSESIRSSQHPEL